MDEQVREDNQVGRSVPVSLGARLVSLFYATAVFLLLAGQIAAQTPTPLEFTDFGLGLQRQQSMATRGVFYDAFVHSGKDILTGGSGQLQMKYGRSRSLFGDEGSFFGEVGQPLGWDAYAFAYASDPKQKAGLRFNLRMQDVSSSFTGHRAMGFADWEVGYRRQDYSARFDQGAFGFTFGENRFEDRDTGAGFEQRVLGASAYGFTYQSETLRVDEQARFDVATSRQLSAKPGYNFASRSLVSSRGGFRDINALAGVTDQYTAYGFTSGSLKVKSEERRLTSSRGGLLDMRQGLQFGPVRVERTARSLDTTFAAYADAGYSHWRYLVGGQEDGLAAAVDFGLVGAEWTQTRLERNPTGQIGRSTITESTVSRALLRPTDGLVIGYRHTDSATGAEAMWSEDRSRLTVTDEDEYTASYRQGQHRINLSQTVTATERPGDESSRRALQATYQHGKRTKIDYQETRTRRDRFTVEPPAGEAVEVNTTEQRMQSLSVQTAFGLSVLQERWSGSDEEPARHAQVRYEQQFGARHEVSVGFDEWKNASDRRIALAGYSGVLRQTVPYALGYDWSFRVRPGDTEFSAWHRSLRWMQPSGNRVFDEGERLLTETGVRLAQHLPGRFRLRAEWGVYERDQQMDQERREVALGVTELIGPAGPTAEIGYREMLTAGGDVAPTFFATAQMQPMRGLQLEALLAQRQEDKRKKSQELSLFEKWETEDRHTIRFAASKTVGKDGRATMSYVATPLDWSRRRHADDPEAALLSREVAFGFTTPSTWLVDGLQFRGQYRTFREPRVGDILDSSTREHEASLLWKPNEENSLTATYRAQLSQRGSLEEGQSYLEFQYVRRLRGDGELALSGFFRDTIDPYGLTLGEETYRVGFNYKMPF